jgi:Flp pilus assembly secretin CpaC
VPPASTFPGGGASDTFEPIVLISRTLGVCLALAVVLAASSGEASRLYKEGQKAERAGEIVRAYLLYAQAAGLDPANRQYWARSQALRTRAALVARPLPRPIATSSSPAPKVELPPAPSSLSPEDLADIHRLKPPPELSGTPGRKTLELKGDAKQVFERVALAYGLDVVFDGDYEPGPPLRFRIDDADYREALHQLEAVTGSFLIPLSEKLFMVAKDLPQKRAELEPTVAVTIPIPDPVSVQEAQEMARAVQQTMEILKFGIDSERRLVFIKDRVSKVRPAQKLFEQLSRTRAQVAVELQLLEVDRSSFLSYGFLMPTKFPLVYLGGILNSKPQLAAEFTRLLVFGGGRTLFGFGLANAEMFANMNESTSKSLMHAEVRSLDGSTATFHIGDKFPILTGGYFGQSNMLASVLQGGLQGGLLGGLQGALQGGFQGGSGLPGSFLSPPSFTFEDLGMLLKVTPHVHGLGEVSLDLEAEFKVLAGQSINGIPIIANRKLQSKVRLKNGEWGVVAGLMNVSEARTVSGLAGLSGLPLLGPLFRQNTRTRESSEVVLLLKPKLLSPPPGEEPTPAVYVGSETRLRTPL